MLRYTQGNLLEADAEALVNTVNTVGVMGKGIALMFKEAFPENFKAYQAACKQDSLQLGRMLVTKRDDFIGPKWIINFPTKAHWRFPSRIEWVEAGLQDLVRVVSELGITSIAVPPLGAGNGGLAWAEVKPRIEAALAGLRAVDVVIYEPTQEYQNVAKRSGVEKLTPPRALIAELVRRYSILGIECTLLEVQKLGYFLERFTRKLQLGPIDFSFTANRYGPYSDKLKHMLNGLDGSYLHSDRRLGDARPFDAIRFDESKKERISAYLTAPEAKVYRPALEATADLIDGFESPAAMELLATVDWLLAHQDVRPTVGDLKQGLRAWPSGDGSGERKAKLFDDRMLAVALDALLRSQLLEQEEVEVARGPRGEKRPADVIGNAVRVGRIATGEEPEERDEAPQKDEAAAAMGRKGAAARAAKLTPERRAEIARKAAAKRWGK